MPVELSEGDGIRFRLWQSKAAAMLPDPLGMGLKPYSGSEWTLTATNLSATGGGPGLAGGTVVVGKMFYEDTSDGVTRFGAFHEHIGCTPCASFYESEVRRGPFISGPGARVVKSIRSVSIAWRR